jgi:predicted nucleic acid-binding protein
VILVDSDVLLALVDRGHRQHHACVEALRTLREPLATIWPVLGAALTSSDGLPAAQSAILEMIGRGAVRLLPLGADEAPAVAALLTKRHRKPCSFAHAALAFVAQRDRLRSVFTLAGAPLVAAWPAGGKRPRVVPSVPAVRRRRRSTARVG